MSLSANASPQPSRVLLVAVASAFLVGLDSMITVPLVPAIAEDTGTAAR